MILFNSIKSKLISTSFYNNFYVNYSNYKLYIPINYFKELLKFN